MLLHLRAQMQPMAVTHLQRVLRHRILAVDVEAHTVSVSMLVVPLPLLLTSLGKKYTLVQYKS